MISKEQYYFLRNQSAFCQFSIEQFDQLAQGFDFGKFPRISSFSLLGIAENISLFCKRDMLGLSSLTRPIPILI